MPQGAEPPIHERWWLMRQFSDADRDAHSARLKLKRELRDYLLAQMERYEITVDDLSAALTEQSVDSGIVAPMTSRMMRTMQPTSTP